ncbi:MAG: glycosyltransferase family 4 protein [Verrucomicrobiota bacterium]
MLNPWETTLDGRCLGRGRVRCHLGHRLPDLRLSDAVIVNTALTGLTTQHLIRYHLRNVPWIFLGEILTRHTNPVFKAIQSVLTAPLKQATAIGAIGAHAAQDYQQRFPATPVFPTRYFCSLEAFRRNHPLPRKPNFRFLFAGQMIERKGIDILLTAFESVASIQQNLELHLTGRRADLDSHLAKLPPDVRKRIIDHGFTAPNQLPDLFASTDCFVLPSRHDGWGVVINQAIGAGLPIIATDAVGAAGELIRPGENGLIVPAADASQLASAMRLLTEDDALRLRMGQANARLAVDLTPEAGAAGWHQHLSKIL